MDYVKIPLEEIKASTNNFSREKLIGRSGSGNEYKGELSHHQGRIAVTISRFDRQFGRGNKEFLAEISMFSYYKHKNIVSLVGYCDESDEKIVVLEYVKNGGLDKYIASTSLTWMQRMQICVGVAHGLNFLHNGAGLQQRVIHRDLNSSVILLDENWEPKITGFGLSKTDPFTMNSTLLITKVGGSFGYLDPYYIKTGVLTKESDTYSFGIVLFEILCCRMAFEERYGETGRFLGPLAMRHYENGKLDELIDPILREQMDPKALTTFADIAYQCLNSNRRERPSMDLILKELEKALAFQLQMYTVDLPFEIKNLEHMKIPLKEIILATQDFHDKFAIGHGGYGKMYRADLFHFDVVKYSKNSKFKSVSMAELSAYLRRKSKVAIKRLDHRYEQGTREFLQDISVFPYLSHQNLVALVGFCDEDHERILVYEYASNGSLEEYICRDDTRNSFPWMIRLQFCLDAAIGLNFLHQFSGIHYNIRSSNILLDRNGVGMIGDFGLSTVRHTYMLDTSVMTQVGGSLVYVDPQYQKTSRLTKESDVYSFGVILLEVLSGRLAQFQISKADQEFSLDTAKRWFKKKKINKIVDPKLKKEFEKSGSAIADDKTCPNSLHLFAAIAYQCFQEEPDQRPTMADVVDELDKALKSHVNDLKEKLDGEDDPYKIEHLGHLKIPFKEIYSATHGLHKNHMIGNGGFGGVYKAELFHVDVRKYVGKNESHELSGYPRRKGIVALKRLESNNGQGRREFLKEIEVLSGLNHQNLVPLLGFCDEYGEMILIYDYASNQSLDKYIPNIQRQYNLTWAQRLQICIDTAQGLNYLHNHNIIHRDMKTPNILLGGSLVGMIGDLGLSITVKNADSPSLNVNPVGTGGYIDPKYRNQGILTKQSDIYSLGVVLLEMFCGRFVIGRGPGNEKYNLVNVAKLHLSDKQPFQIIAQYLREEFEKSSIVLENKRFMDSINTFAALTHECLHCTETETHRLTMSDVIKELKKSLTFHLIGVEVLPLQDIKSATNCFNDANVIGKGASGTVYKGELTLSKGPEVFAVKKLDRVGSYGEAAFLKEVALLSLYVHENIITLRGFCEEENEKIVILEHATNGSLDMHLDKSTLTWGLRLKIAIGAAKGLHHVHCLDDVQTTYHGDVKSSNILLDRDWKASISDFIISKGHGTLGYIDPLYFSGGATKESDVYAFGVVLFELLSGKLAIEKAEKYPQHRLRQIINSEPESNTGDESKDEKVVFLDSLAVRCYEDNILEEIIFDGTENQTDAKSLNIFSEVAYQCLHKNRNLRPTMASVIDKLEEALNIHDEWEWEQKLPIDYESVMKMTRYRPSRTITKKDLYSRLCSGILIGKGKAWFSLNKNGKASEMISATEFSYKNLRSLKWRSTKISRFSKVAKMSDTSNLNIQIQIKTQFLSVGIVYGAYVVFKFCYSRMGPSEPYVNLKYKTSSGNFNAYIADGRDDKWMMIELCRFMNDNQIIEFEVLLKSFCGHSCGSGPIFIEGIEFRPIENVHHEANVQRTINMKSNIDWPKQCPSEFEDIMKRSDYDVPAMTIEELDILRWNGVFIDNGEKLFWLSKLNGRKSHMLPAKVIIDKSLYIKCSSCKPSSRSRFAEVVELQSHQALRIKCNIETPLLSPDTSYMCYLVFNFPDNSLGLKCPIKARDLLDRNYKDANFFYFRSPTSFAELYKLDKRFPGQRDDGWMEVCVWELLTPKQYNSDYLPMDVKLVCLEGTMFGLTICGIEFRPR